MAELAADGPGDTETPAEMREGVKDGIVDLSVADDKLEVMEWEVFH